MTSSIYPNNKKQYCFVFWNKYTYVIDGIYDRFFYQNQIFNRTSNLPFCNDFYITRWSSKRLKNGTKNWWLGQWGIFSCCICRASPELRRYPIGRRGSVSKLTYHWWYVKVRNSTLILSNMWFNWFIGVLTIVNDKLYYFRRFKSEKELVRQMVLELVNRNLVKPVGGAGMPAGMPGNLVISISTTSKIFGMVILHE